MSLIVVQGKWKRNQNGTLWYEHVTKNHWKHSDWK